MEDRQYRILLLTAIVLTVAWVLWSIYDTTPQAPGDIDYIAANKFFEDRQYDEALAGYERALQEDPEHIHALRGMARALLKLDRLPAAVNVANQAIAREPQFAATYANRGIMHDQLGDYEAAARDYETAIRLDPELQDGPHWMTRFLRNQAARPPGIGERARYLREQLAKPEAERLLRVPEEDAKQRPYKR